MSYRIDDGHGQQIAVNIQPSAALKTAQAAAHRLGATVFLSDENPRFAQDIAVDPRSQKDDLDWARDCRAGDYLLNWSLMPIEIDPGNREGRTDEELDAIKRELSGRGLRLEADDQGMVARPKDG